MTDYTFKDKTHNTESLTAMSIEDLLALRNEVAEDLGVAAVKSFKDHETAVAQTEKALVRHAETAADTAADDKKSKAKTKTKTPKEPKEYVVPKSAEAKTVKRPTRAMFSTIKKTGEHDGKDHGRHQRWPNYTDGMTIVDVMEKHGTEPWDVQNWVSKGIMSLTEPTDEQYAERRAAWYKKEGREDPDLKKAREKQEREAAKAKREAEAAEKAKADELAKAEKAKADAEAKAQAEAAG